MSDIRKEFEQFEEQPTAPVMEAPANKYGWSIDYLRKHYRFKYNLVNEELEWHNGCDENFKKMSKRDLDLIYTRLKHQQHELITPDGVRMVQLGLSRDDLRAAIGSVLSREFDPLKEYLFALDPWDGETDHIREHLAQVVLEDESEREIFVEYFKRWFVATVGSALNEHVINHTCFVIVSKQGHFKTTFLNELLPAELRMEYLYAGYFDFANKDHLKYLATKWIVNLDEMAALNKAEITQLKSVMTMSKVTIRKPYAEIDSNMTRRASFCGNTNNAQFLTDETGSRRFLPFSIRTINYQQRDVSGMYAQALALFKGGFKYWFDRDDIGEVEARNAAFNHSSIEEEMILRWVTPATEAEFEDNRAQALTTTEINEFLIKKLSRNNMNETTLKRVGMLLKKYNFIQKKHRRGSLTIRVWLVRLEDSGRTDEEIKVEVMKNII